MRADPVADAVGVQRLERAPDGRRADHLAGVRNRPEPALAREPECVGELLGRRLSLDAAEPDADDAAVAAGDRMAHDSRRLLGRRRAVQVGREPHLDAEPLARLLDAVAVALEQRVQLDPVPAGTVGAKIPSMYTAP